MPKLSFNELDSQVLRPEDAHLQAFMAAMRKLFADGLPITTGDIEIGAVELKNSNTDARANILPANTARTTATVVLAVQNVDAAGNPVSPITPKQSSGTPSNFAIATADGTVFTLAAGERGFIQNLDGADALAVKLGATASTTSFNFLLKPGAAADDGNGGFVQIDDWVGVVSVATMTGAGRYIAWKQTI